MPKFWRRGVSKARFAPAVANLAAPTRAEITAGADLSPSIAEINGWELTNTPIVTPNLADTFDSNIPGPDSVSDSSLVLDDIDTGSPLRTTLAKGNNGFIIWMPYGDVATRRCEVFPVRSSVVSDNKTLDAVNARFTVGFAIPAQPNTEGVIPAL